MRAVETCRCGSTITLEDRYSSAVSFDLKRWQDRHTQCLEDKACEQCGRRGRAMVTATIGGETFRLCASCGEDAAENGCEVSS